MAGFTPAVLEAAALEVTGSGDFISLHTADPGTTGASEATGGSPAYARKQTVWTGSSDDGAVAGSQVEFDLPAGTYTHVGIWSLVTGGDFIGSVALFNPIVMTGQGQARITPTITAS